MNIIIIEDSVYSVSDKQLEGLTNYIGAIDKEEFYLGQELDKDNYLQLMKQHYKFLGRVNFHFTL